MRKKVIAAYNIPKMIGLKNLLIKHIGVVNSVMAFICAITLMPSIVISKALFLGNSVFIISLYI